MPLVGGIKMTEQQLDDYYYGYNLRLADELGLFDEYIKQPPTLEGKKELCKELEQDIIVNTHEYCGWDEERIITEILNPEL